MEKISAEEAKLLSDKANRTMYDKQLNLVFNKILEATNEGKYNCEYKCKSYELLDLLDKELTALGYTITRSVSSNIIGINWKIPPSHKRIILNK